MSKPHESGQGLGPNGECVCVRCGYETTHIPGKPCMERRCPECDAKLMRRGSEHHRAALKAKERASSREA